MESEATQTSNPTDRKPYLSLIVPVYNDAGTLDTLVETLAQALGSVEQPSEIIIIDDGSKDGTADKLASLAEKYPTLVGIILTKNFGQHSALSAGLDYSRGEWIVFTDSDEAFHGDRLQLMMSKIEGDVMIVNGKLITRNQGLWRRFTSFLAELLLTRTLKGTLPTYLYTILLIHRRAVDVVRKMPERRRNIHGMFAWTGFPLVTVELERVSEFKRRSHYRYHQLLRMFLELITAFAYSPLFFPARVAYWLGFSAAIAACILLAAGELISDSLVGKSAAILNMLLFSLTFGFLGVIGAYIARINSQTRLRPLYLVLKVFGQNAPDGPQP